MNKIIFRNIAIVSAIFIVAFSTMLVTNYFQTRDVTPLQTEVVETLKQLNDVNANNPVLQEQIRQLDLLARKAYFVQHDRLITGVYILLGMLAVFLVCARLYFAGDKDIPDKDVDPVDEWAVKTKARKYVVWSVSGLAAIALVFVILNSPHLQTAKAETDKTETSLSPTLSPQEMDEHLISETTDVQTAEIQTTEIQTTDTPETANISETPVAETVAQPAVSKVSHNAFRGNNSNGISEAKGVPVKWDLAKGTNIAWKIETPRPGYNSPVINGNKVFFTGADEEVRELFCYDLITGKKLWSLTAVNIPGSPEKAPETTEDTGLAASSVATNGKQVCAIFGTGDLICTDMDGNRLWAKNLGVPDNHYGYASSLLTYGNLIIIQYDNRTNSKVMALDIATGAERWSRNRTERYMNWASPVIAYINNTPQLVLMGCPSMTAYNPNNGEQLWRVEFLMGEPAASACSANGIVYGASDGAKLVAVNPADGSVLWDNNDFLPEVASPVATKDNIYIATTYGVVASFDTQNGKLRVEHELGSNFYSSPIIADEKLFLIDMEGKAYIFSADDEFKLLDSFETGEPTFATPAFTDGKIVVRTGKSIYCVSAK